MILNIPYYYQAEILKKRARKSKIYNVLDYYPVEIVDINENDTRLIALECNNIHRNASIYREIDGKIYSQFKISPWLHRDNKNFFNDIKYLNNDINAFLNNLNENITVDDISGFNANSLKEDPDTYVCFFSNKHKKYEIWDQNKEEPFKLMKSNNKEEILMQYKTKYPKIYNVNGIVYVPNNLPYFNIEKISDKPYESSYGLYNIQNNNKYFSLPLNMINCFENISEDCFLYCEQNDLLFYGEPNYTNNSFMIIDIKRYNELFDLNKIKEQIIEDIFSSVNDPILDNIDINSSLEELNDIINYLLTIDIKPYFKNYLENARILTKHTMDYMNNIHNTSEQNNIVINGSIKKQSNFTP